MLPMPTQEHVLVIPRAVLDQMHTFQGFLPTAEFDITRLLNPAHYAFHPRAEMETDSTYKQLIPYVVLRHGDNLFHYRRGASGTETRLRALRSLGIGGHISREDAAGGTDPYVAGMTRELQEEVAIPHSYTSELIGVINDDRLPVGQVHLGVVHLLTLSQAEVTPREDALAECGFAPLGELRTQADEFETWSQFVLDWLITSSR